VEEGYFVIGYCVLLASVLITNLYRRGVIPLEAQMCVAAGCGFQETENHLFLSCPLFDQIWQLVRNWLCVYSADHYNIVDHFYQFGTIFGGAKSRRSHAFVLARLCLGDLEGKKR